MSEPHQLDNLRSQLDVALETSRMLRAQINTLEGRVKEMCEELQAIKRAHIPIDPALIHMPIDPTLENPPNGPWDYATPWGHAPPMPPPPTMEEQLALARPKRLRRRHTMVVEIPVYKAGRSKKAGNGK
ncbi:unnamed protein product [Rhizoctonia solani]|uniref:Uncharacterized protein n=1 Tax=Rhizoctonia solani TaxID=456999 RepID=A0A8H2XRP3_9AGAM|nr:unnamed protein product [Rhizoctonia solani]